MNTCIYIAPVKQKSSEVLGSKETPIGNGIWAIEWSRDRWRHVTLKG